MLFTSLAFWKFFAIVLAAYWVCRPWRQVQQLILLAASYYFYAQFRWFFPVTLAALTLTGFGGGLWVAGTKGPAERRTALATSLIVSVMPLVVWKYAGFFAGLFQWTQGQDYVAGWLAPIGLSFYTFAIMGYLVDVYRQAPVEKDPLRFGLFAALFPYVLSGPIPRSQTMLPQLEAKATIDWSMIQQAVFLIAWGLFAKMVVADQLGGAVNYAFGRWQELSGGSLWLGAVLFSIQLYADFSGYSSVAIGLLLLLGLRLPPNFLQPYFADSLQAFWQRWHISLSSWFRDYLYLPLGGSRVSKTRWQANILIVFGVSGLWHGAGLNYLIWGLMHGFGLVVEKEWKKWPFTQVFPVVVLQRIVLLMFVVIAWVFFKVTTLEQGWGYVTKLFAPATDYLKIPSFLWQQAHWAALLLLLEGIYLIQQKQAPAISRQVWLKPALALGLALLIWQFHKTVSAAEYYYFKY